MKCQRTGADCEAPGDETIVSTAITSNHDTIRRRLKKKLASGNLHTFYIVSQDVPSSSSWSSNLVPICNIATVAKITRAR